MAKHVAEEHLKPVFMYPATMNIIGTITLIYKLKMRRFANQTENVIFLDNDVFE